MTNESGIKEELEVKKEDSVKEKGGYGRGEEEMSGDKRKRSKEELEDSVKEKEWRRKKTE